MTLMTNLNNSKNMSVYFDGLCYLCSREINQYKKMKGAENINFVDITDSSFHVDQVGLDPIQIHKSLHVRNNSGLIFTGVDAFICIWKELPALKFLAPIASAAPIHFLLEIFYTLFTKVRPLLPRKSCENSPYCERNSKK